MIFPGSVRLFLSFPLSLQLRPTFLQRPEWLLWWRCLPMLHFLLLLSQWTRIQLLSWIPLIIFFKKSQNRGQNLATSVLRRRCLSLRYVLLENQRGAVGESVCVGLVREEQKEASMYRVCLRGQLKILTASIHSWLHNCLAVIVL